MNKKYFLMIGMVSLFAIALVAAAVMEYYGAHQETLEVFQPILVNGVEGYDNINPDLINCEAGQICFGTLLTIENRGNNPVSVMLNTIKVENSSIEDIYYINSEWDVFNLNFGRNDCSEVNTWCDGADINEDGEVDLVDWNIIRLNPGVSFTDGSVIVIQPNQTLELTPSYKIFASAESGTEEVTIEVNPTA